MAAEHDEIDQRLVLPEVTPKHPPTEAGFIEQMTELAHNWRYSDALIGNAVRHWLGRGNHDGTVAPGVLSGGQASATDGGEG